MGFLSRSFAAESYHANPICQHCKTNPISRAANYHLMYLTGITDPKDFDEQYGMVCLECGQNLLEKLVAERGYTEQQIVRAHDRSLEANMKDWRRTMR